MDRYLTAQSQSTTDAASFGTGHVQHRSADENGGGGKSEGDNAEEYVVESVLGHFCDNEGVKYYLVKWEGYEDSHDWLTEEELQGAAEVVAQYNERVQRRKGKQKA